MGRTILCKKCQSTFNETILVSKDDPNVCPVCGESLLEDDEISTHDEHPDWITWYYYRDEETDCFTLRDEPIDLTVWTDTKLIKEFKAPPRDSNGRSDKAKEILRTYIPDAFSEAKAKETSIYCPRCGCSEFTLLNRGYSIWTGFLGSGKVKRVCNRCKKEF